jgi:hypothetical protein
MTIVDISGRIDLGKTAVDLITLFNVFLAYPHGDRNLSLDLIPFSTLDFGFLGTGKPPTSPRSQGFVVGARSFARLLQVVNLLA